MANSWLRLYAETLNDPKIQGLPPLSFKAWINALCWACGHDNLNGNLGTLHDVSFAFRETKESVSSAFHPLIELSLIVTDGETFQIKSWKKRQYKSDTSTERVRKHRESKRVLHETLHETPPEQSRADTEQSRAEAAANPLPEQPDASPKFLEIIQAFDASRTEIWGDSQSRLAPASLDSLTAEDWLKSGITPEFCRQHFREEMTKMHSKNRSPPRTLKFFDASLREAFSRGEVPKSTDLSEPELWRLRIKAWKEKQLWVGNLWGEPPQSGRCECPPEILKELGVAA